MMEAILSLSFSIQFFAFGLILIFKKTGNLLSNKIFGTSVVLLGIAGVQFLYLQSSDFDDYIIWVVDLPWFFSFCYLPLVYFNALVLAKEKLDFGKRFWVHFIPALAALFYFSKYYLLSAEEKKAYLHLLRTQPDNSDIGTALFALLFYLLFLIYTIAAIRKFSKHEKTIHTFFSDAERYTLRWYKHAYVFILLLSFIAIALNILQAQYYYYIPVMAGLLGVQYLIVYFVFNQPVHDVEIPAEEVCPPVSETLFNDLSKLPDDIDDKIKRLMLDEKLFLNPKLTLFQLAEKLDISAHLCSAYLNKMKQMNFNDFVNQYRVQHACKLLEEGWIEKYSIEQLGTESGFNSKAAFYKSFKKQTGQTPKEYLEGARA